MIACILARGDTTRLYAYLTWGVRAFFFFSYSYVPFMKLLVVEHVHAHQVAWNPTIARTIWFMSDHSAADPKETTQVVHLVVFCGVRLP